MNDWRGFFEKIYVLTVDIARERYEKVAHHLTVDVQVKFEPVIFKSLAQGVVNDGQAIPSSSTQKGVTTTNSLWDIFQHNITDEISNHIACNHLYLIARAYKAGYANVVILEDDAEFVLPLPESKLQRAVQWLETESFDICYLGYCPWPIPVSFWMTSDIVRIVSPYCAHAYVLSRQGMEKVLTHAKTRNLHHFDIHYDRFLAEIPNFIKYGIFPMVCFQSIDPALYRRACQTLFSQRLTEVGIVPSFRTVNRVLEYIAVIVPCLVFVLILCIAVWCVMIVRRRVLKK